MLLKLDFSGDDPIYMQIRDQIVMLIADGSLTAGERLPAIRRLADEAGVNMMTVNKAYALLKSEGYITADRRSGAVVSASRGTAREIDPYLERKLRIAIAEAKLSGVPMERLTELCREVYSEGVDADDAHGG